MTRRAMVVALAGGCAVLASPAAAQNRSKVIAPYIELNQVVTADLQTDDVLTYTSIAAGVDASIQTQRTQVALSYRYERRIAWDDDVGDDDVHSGLARAAISLAPGVSLEGGALATRARSDIRGAAPGVLAGNVSNISQVFSAYVGPTLATQSGPFSIGAAYRYGYTKVEDPGFKDVPGGPVLDNYDDANSHVATASIATRAGTLLPVGVTLSGSYEREDAHQLSQRYEGYYGRGDLLLPVTPTLALAAGAGYERIEVSSRDAQLDAAGNPVLDENGRFVEAANGFRRIAYNTDGWIWDAGVVWRPSPRTSLTATVGRRYGSTIYTGSFTWAVRSDLGLQIGVYDQVDTFARQLRRGIAGLPTSFLTERDAFAQTFSGCTFGTSSAAIGGCLNGVFQSIATASYRSRGVDAVLQAQRGPLSYGVGAGYANRRFFGNPNATWSLYGITDESYYAQGFLAAQLTPVSGINADVFANYFESGLGDAPGVTSVGATGLYYRNWGRLGATASLGIYNFSQDGADDQTSATAQVGMRYQF
ncbi:TonB-dependent receptor [Sphingomonas aracearum]|uniref:TonB-dependent receptor n=1 Tax=Sphingomonas aracearum TaxID=2283317 RepID=A0A369VW56_9SPHN|nr:TonB-dependent receptor [Sphingomonas aracearum]RDE06578.1 TonB-dependent receptor [Sphingomonas aracearum]